MSRLHVVFILAIGLLSGFGLAHAIQSPPANAELKKDDPPNRALDANLYMQISAEYQACCYQAYALASERLKTLTGQPQSGKPKAVILDLDETVIDNRGYQSTILRNGWAFDPKLWLKWEKNHAADVVMVPGAKEFIEQCQQAHIAIVYISNRTEINRDGTKAILDRLGIAVPDAQLLLNKSTTNTDKSTRRDQARELFNVVMIVGDNLRDFDESFKYDKTKGAKGRDDALKTQKSKFGAEWIIIPNPAYGEWAKALGQGAKDLELLSPDVQLKP
jgi:5'-nucleotidase (lipoprotein e(P4) family)